MSPIISGLLSLCIDVYSNQVHFMHTVFFENTSKLWILKQMLFEMVQLSESLTILQMEKDLRSHVDSLSTQKQKRLQQLRQRLQVDEQLCASLGTTPFHIPPSCVVPTEQQLADFDDHIQQLEAEKV